ncbi:MAG: hypothetical protein LCH87_10965 [Actinobacteria bacterium]|nr:hypothetical protein [Actinomycetota bacterium]
MVVDGYRELERMLREFGLRQLEELAWGWQGHGFGPAETAQWLTAGVGADEPQLAAALAAAEWTPAQAGRALRGGLTAVQAVRDHPDGARLARELRALAG